MISVSLFFMTINLIRVQAIAFGLEGPEVASLLVALVAAGGAWATQRAASRASRQTTNEAGRADIEKEAFLRAQKFLDGTIQRQDDEIAELRGEVDGLRSENTGLREEIGILRREKDALKRENDRHEERIVKLEEQIHG